MTQGPPFNPEEKKNSKTGKAAAAPQITPRKVKSDVKSLCENRGWGEGGGKKGRKTSDGKLQGEKKKKNLVEKFSGRTAHSMMDTTDRRPLEIFQRSSEGRG